MLFYRYEIPDYWLWEDHGYTLYKEMHTQIRDYFKDHVERQHMETLMDEFERGLISKNEIFKTLKGDISFRKYKFIFTESGQKRFATTISALRKFCIENRISFKIIIYKADTITDDMMIYKDEYRALINISKFHSNVFII